MKLKFWKRDSAESDPTDEYVWRQHSPTIAITPNPDTVSAQARLNKARSLQAHAVLRSAADKLDRKADRKKVNDGVDIDNVLLLRERAAELREAASAIAPPFAGIHSLLHHSIY